MVKGPPLYALSLIHFLKSSALRQGLACTPLVHTMRHVMLKNLRRGPYTRKRWNNTALYNEMICLDHLC